MQKSLTRRGFIQKTCAGAAAAGLASPASVRSSENSPPSKLAILGGKPVRKEPYPSWPVIADNDERTWMEVFRTGRWNRLGGSYVERFEKAWAEQLGAKGCLATASGTSALYTALNAMGVGPGDEVLVPPYTFVATINVVLLQHALPVFVDTDRETMQIDAGKIESAITPRTRCILPVHIGGYMANLDVILEVGKRRNIPVLEDACQAHLAEWRGRKAGTLGTMGCFSFQASKNLNSGEGGAIVSDNRDLLEICLSFHNQGRAAPNSGFSYVRNGDNRRLTEFQGALLLEQLTRLEEQSRLREKNAATLNRLLGEIPGITPAKMYDGCTKSAYHLYMFRYDKTRFANIHRDRVLKAVQAEGIPCSGGYSPLEREPFLKETLDSRAYKLIYGEKTLAAVKERIRCPENAKLCEEAIWLTQNVLLGSTRDMEQIAEAFLKIQKEAPLLARS